MCGFAENHPPFPFRDFLGRFVTDMTLENILLDKRSKAKIIYLGMALMVDRRESRRDIDSMVVQGGAVPGGRRTTPPTGPCGKKRCMAPEFAMNEQPFDGLAVDVWAYEVMLFMWDWSGD